MSPKDWLDYAVQVGILVGLVSAGYWGIRRWVSRIAADQRKTADQLQTSNGKTVAGYVEQVATRVEHIEASVTALAEQGSSNRDLANSALALARGAHERLDDHLLKHPDR